MTLNVLTETRCHSTAQSQTKPRPRSHHLLTSTNLELAPCVMHVTVLSYRPTSIQQQRSHIDFTFTDIRKCYQRVCLKNKT